MFVGNQTIIAISFILQAIGFLGILYAWIKALQEFRDGGVFPKTRLLLFIITTVTLSAYIVPTMISICYFKPGCFQPQYRDDLRLFSGIILFLYGLFKFLLYYTKEKEVHPVR